jgi:hypothetical protein
VSWLDGPRAVHGPWLLYGIFNITDLREDHVVVKQWPVLATLSAGEGIVTSHGTQPSMMDSSGASNVCIEPFLPIQVSLAGYAIGPSVTL